MSTNNRLIICLIITFAAAVLLLKPTDSAAAENFLGISNPYPIIDPVKPTPIMLPVQCRVGGCSGQLCVDASQGPINSTCEWKDEYACYHTARCKVQDGGQCGWTMTPELQACLDQAQNQPTIEPQPSMEPNPQPICDRVCPTHQTFIPPFQCIPQPVSTKPSPPPHPTMLPIPPTQPTMFPLPTPRPTPSFSYDHRQLTCHLTGGHWTEFNNGCADTCAYTANAKLPCTQALTNSCDCGPDRCWTDSYCAPNPLHPFPNIHSLFQKFQAFFSSSQ